MSVISQFSSFVHSRVVHLNVAYGLLILAAIPSYAAIKFVWAVYKAKSLEAQIISRNIPYPKDLNHPIWGLGQFLAEMPAGQAHTLLHSKLGDVYVWRALDFVNVSVADPKLAQYVISKLNLPKAPYDAVRDLVGYSVLTTNGAEWQHKRKSVNPAFKVSFLQNILVPVVVSRTLVMFDNLFPKAPEGASLDFLDICSKVTLDVIGLAGFNYDFGFSSSTSVGDGFSARMLNLLEVPTLRNRNPLRRYYKIRESIQYSRDLSAFKALGLKAIREERARQNERDQDEPPSSIIGLLLQQSNLSEQDLHNEVNTFLFAGHETSASTISFMFILLDIFPHVKAKVIQEVEEVLGGRDPTFEDIGKFKYITAVMKETLRFFPIAWGTARITTEETKLGQYILPANTHVLVNFVALQRNPSVWEKPLEFKPERWLSSTGEETTSENVDERSTGIIPFSYLPFSGGPRSCIGKPFAEIEIKIVTAMIVQKYDWKVQTPAEWKGRPFYDLYNAGTTLRPLPHYVHIIPRK